MVQFERSEINAPVLFLNRSYITDSPYITFHAKLSKVTRKIIQILINKFKRPDEIFIISKLTWFLGNRIFFRDIEVKGNIYAINFRVGEIFKQFS